MKNPYFYGFGHYVPERVLTNADLEKMVDTSDEWITSRTGIKERHIAAPGQATSDLAVEAAKAALADAGIDADELTHIVLATLTPDCYCPSSSVMIQHKLGIKGKICHDVNAACSGFLYALETARGILCLHPEAVVLVCAGEVLTSRTNWRDRTTCVLFGDAAGAVVLKNGAGPGAKARLADIHLSSDGSLWELLTVKGGGSAFPMTWGDEIGETFFIQMNGREVFKHALRCMESACQTILTRNALGQDDIAMLIPHQANLRIILGLGKHFGIPEERVYVNVDRYGNSSAASLALALAEAVSTGRVHGGDKVLLTAFGGGFTWGAALLEF